MTEEPRRVTLVPGGDLPSAAVHERNYGYIAVAGGIAVPRVLGGRGTCLPGGFGGHEGRELRIGDRLMVGMGPGMARSGAGGAGAVAGAGRGATAAVEEATEPGHAQRLHGFRTVRVLPGDRPVARDSDFRALLDGPWQATSGNRVGLRLDGPRLFPEPLRLSQPLPPGAIQVTGSGQPIVLLRDHPTVGGYPVVAVVVSADLDVIAQARTGDRINFIRA
jgi:antagonist of KipI